MENEAPTQDIREQRIDNLARLEELGYQPFGAAFERTLRMAELADEFEEGKTARLAGRLVARREMGKSIFAHIQDVGGKFQVYLKKNDVGEEAFAAFKILDLGDHVGVEGELFTTRTGEPTLKVAGWTLLSKSLLPLPEKWHGLSDVDTRFRQRYLDLVANEASRKVFQQRAAILRAMRIFLWDRGFTEAETPMIQYQAGGAAATPFKTHYEALGVDMFLRIAPELYLKRLLVGGYDKVFELNRNFRNEGLSRSHNPEFTMLEIYQAYGDVKTMQALIQDMVAYVAGEVMGTLKVGAGDRIIDLTPPWRTVTYHELVREAAGDDWFELSLEDARARGEKLGLEIDPAWGPVEVTQEVFEKLIEKNLVQPTFVTRLPVELVPLAKACEDDPTLVDVFELIVDGRELAPGYSELNNPLEQRKRFQEQSEGDAEKIDEDFITSMEHGMPPAGGMGVGIDRLVMTLTGAESIRDVILFPQLKPKAE